MADFWWLLTNIKAVAWRYTYIIRYKSFYVYIYIFFFSYINKKVSLLRSVVSRRKKKYIIIENCVGPVVFWTFRKAPSHLAADIMCISEIASRNMIALCNSQITHSLSRAQKNTYIYICIHIYLYFFFSVLWFVIMIRLKNETLLRAYAENRFIKLPIFYLRWYKKIYKNSFVQNREKRQLPLKRTWEGKNVWSIEYLHILNYRNKENEIK